MKNYPHHCRLRRLLATLSALVILPFLPPLEAQSSAKKAHRRVSDVLFVWGNPDPSSAHDMSPTGPIKTADLAKFAQAEPASRAAMLGVKNMVMAGHGLSLDPDLADRWSKQISHSKRIVWEVEPDTEGKSEEAGSRFTYSRKIALLKELQGRYPQIEALLLDDMSTVAVKKGFKPEHIAAIRKELGPAAARIKIWGVIYELSLADELLPDYLRQLDVINFWMWHGKDIVNLEKNIERVENLAPGKPIVLGLYLYDYGGKRKLPVELMKSQCEKALALAKAGRIQGIVFLTVNNDPDMIRWTRDWIKTAAKQPL